MVERYHGDNKRKEFHELRVRWLLIYASEGEFRRSEVLGGVFWRQACVVSDNWTHLVAGGEPQIAFQ